MSAPLPPRAARAHAARLLAAAGFREAARNARDDAIYLALPDGPWRLRVANHARTAKQRRRRTDVLTSLVIDAPRSPQQIEVLVRAALGNFFARRAERAADPPGD